LDGHPELYVYPFESQLGTACVSDELLSMFPYKYRWPVFPLSGEPASDFELFFDEELKTRLRRPDGSKFRHADLAMTEADRRTDFMRRMEGNARTVRNLVTAFFGATFDAWKNYRRSGREQCYVGYSPIVGVDAERIFADVPEACVIHVVRHPQACYSETRRRPFPLSLRRYSWTWEFVQRRSLVYKEKFSGKYLVIRYEDLIEKKEKVMRDVCRAIKISYSEGLLFPSWNGVRLENQYPWGTIDFPTAEEQGARIAELPPADRAEIALITRDTAKALGYTL
jgi:hypothetical protein